MNMQRTFADVNTFQKFKRITRREKFLADMEQVVPWKKLCSIIGPFYPKGDKERLPIGLERMLRIHYLQSCFNLSDPGVEEALYDMESMRRFVGIDLGNEPAPDETSVCKFRRRPTWKRLRKSNRKLPEPWTTLISVERRTRS